MKKRMFRFLYYHFAIHLPSTSSRGGGVSLKIRQFLCKRIFEYCGDNVNIEKGASFGYGDKIRIGDNSGLGINCHIPNGSIIGNDVMMGPNCYVFERNHVYSRTDIPMRLQGYTELKPVNIEDDVWIGQDVTIMVGRQIKKGSIVAAGSVLTKDFPEYSIIGGNPAKVIKSRIE
jgi:maltose O-acetyltransferase